MKAISLILLGLFLSTNASATAYPDQFCQSTAQELADRLADFHFEDFPQAVPSPGIEGVEEQGHQFDNITKNDRNVLNYSAKGRYYARVPYGYSTTYQLEINIKMTPQCSVVAYSLQETILNIEPPQNEPQDDMLCAFEMDTICEPGMVDRCGVYPEAETHACVPDTRL